MAALRRRISPAKSHSPTEGTKTAGGSVGGVPSEDMVDRVPTQRRRTAAVAVAFSLAAVAILLASGFAGLGTAAPARPAVTSACPTLNLPTPICHVFVVFFENQQEKWVLSHGPYFKSLANTYSFAADYYSILHYSYPNYVASTSGHVTNYIAPIKATNVASLIRASNVSLTWKAYMQGMPFACDANNITPAYRRAHNPFAQYEDVRANASYCDSHDVNFGIWLKDVRNNNLPNYAFISPNSTNDCWLTGIAACNAWLSTWMPPLMNASWFQSSAFILTFDEGKTNDTSGANGTIGGGHVYTSVVSPYSCAHYVSTYNYTPFDILTTTEWLLNLGRTGTNDSWTLHPPMRDMFCFGNGSVGIHHAAPVATPPTPPASPALTVMARWAGAVVGPSLRAPTRATVGR